MTDLTLFDSDNLTKMYKATDTLAKSSLVPYALRGKPADIFAILVMGQEIGVPPMQSLNSISVIQGKPTMGAQLLLALCRSKVKDFSLSIEVLSTGQDASIKAIGKRGEDSFTTTWDMNRAAMMGLIGKDNYKKQPETMLKWRAVSEVCRTLCPDAIAGFYAKEELIDFDGKEIEIEPEPNDVDLYHEKLKKENPTHYELGHPDFVIQNAKFRGKQLKNIDDKDLTDYYDTLEARSKKQKLKDWEAEVMHSIALYMEGVE